MWYDVVVLAVLIFFTIRGAMKGVIWQLAGIAGITICFLFADGISQTVGPLIAPHVKLQEPLNHWLILFASYLVLSLASFAFARSLNKWVEQADMKEYNRHLGGILGFVKGALLVLIATFLIVTVSPDARTALKSSKTGWACAHIMYHLHPILPPKLHEAVGAYIHALDDEQLANKYDEHDHTVSNGSHNHGQDAPLFGGAPAVPNQGGGSAPVWGQPASSPATPQTPVDPRAFWLQVQQDLGNAAAKSLYESITSGNPQTQPQAQAQLADLLRRTTPEQRQQFAQEVVQSQGNISYLFNRWLGTPTSPSTPSATTGSQNPFDFLGQPAAPPVNTNSSPSLNPFNTNAPVATQGTNGSVPASPPLVNVSQLTPQQLTARRQELVTRIAGRVTSLPAIRDRIAQTIDGQLVQARVPDAMAVTILEDWHADVAGEPDPAPATTRDTGAAQRILYHLQSLQAQNPQNGRQF